MKLTTARAVQDYLPAGSTAGTLTRDLVDPVSTSAGVLGGQIVALMLSVAFDDAGALASASPIPLGDLVVQSGKFVGLTVRNLLALANNAMSGKTTVLTPYQATLSDLNAAVDTINNCFDNCQTVCDFVKP
jgi:hypothetical protein